MVSQVLIGYVTDKIKERASYCSLINSVLNLLALLHFKSSQHYALVELVLGRLYSRLQGLGEKDSEAKVG